MIDTPVNTASPDASGAEADELDQVTPPSLWRCEKRCSLDAEPPYRSVACHGIVKVTP